MTIACESRRLFPALFLKASALAGYHKWRFSPFVADKMARAGIAMMMVPMVTKIYSWSRTHDLQASVSPRFLLSRCLRAGGGHQETKSWGHALHFDAKRLQLGSKSGKVYSGME